MASNGCDTERTAAGSVVVRTFDKSCDINPTSISRSILVTDFQATTTPEDLIIHFQRKRNGGGDIESIAVNNRGTAVITFEKPEVITTVLKEKQVFGEDILTVKPYVDNVLDNDQHFEVFELVSAELCLEYVESISREQTQNLLRIIAAKTGVRWIESAENFSMSGTFKQVEESRAFLQQGIHQSNGIVVVDKVNGGEIRSQRREQSESRLDDKAEKEEEANHGSSILEDAIKAIRPEEDTKEIRSDHKPSFLSDVPKIQSFEIEPKIVKAFMKSHRDKLDDIEAKHQIEIPRKPEGTKISLKPRKGCSAEEYEEACNLFINLYQKMYQLVKMERFSLKSEKLVVRSREAISKAEKIFPISIEISKDHKHWEMYGEASHIEDALKYLEQEGVEIKRELKMAMDEDGRRQKAKDYEEDMDVDPPDYYRDAKSPGNPLVTYFGKVKFSVYKGDITKEKVDVIVNAANENLQHVGGVAKAILEKGGKTIEDESRRIIRERGPLRDGEAVVTKSGKLSCKVVVHAVGPMWKSVGAKKSKHLLRHACINSLLETEKLKMTSIALPAIGSGIYGMPKNVCAQVMFDAVDQFIRQGDPKKKTITDIRLVDIDDPSVQAFVKEFIARYGGNREGRSPGEGSSSLPSAGTAEGGSNTAPSSRRGKNKYSSMPNSDHPTVNANESWRENQQHHTSFGSLSADKDHPLSASSPPSPTSYSSAVKGIKGGNDGKSSKGGGGGKTEEKEEENCPICLDTKTNPRALKCKHSFCSVCLKSALEASNRCPVCQEPQGVLQGNQPRGEMTSRCERYSVPGYEGHDTIIINYHFPSGIQGREHPNPGQRYDSTSRIAYLPNTRAGQEVLQLLRRAFDARLLFTVGTSSTTGRSNQITWNDIHHKTSVSGGPYGFGYPDPDYLRRVKEELAAKGIR